jgi:pyruvyltransferase
MASPKSFIRRIETRLEFEAFRAWGYTLACIYGKGITAYWWREVPNFGDLITPLLLRHYGYTPVYECPERAEFVATGSILEVLPADFSGIILGAGFIHERTRRSFPNATLLAVRGMLTRERLGPMRKTVALGDPGILASLMMKRQEEKKFVLGIIPHHESKEKPIIARLVAKLQPDVIIIDVKRHPMQVFVAIDQCSHILSSSLHGLIVADSLGVPSGWLYSEGMLGGRFKFDDYYSSLGFSPDLPITLTGTERLGQLVAFTSLKPRDNIEQMKLSLHRLWSTF